MHTKKTSVNGDKQAAVIYKMTVEDRKPQAGGVNKETLALFVSAICLAGVIHVEWKIRDLDTQMILLQGNDFRSWSNGRHKSDLTDGK